MNTLLLKNNPLSCLRETSVWGPVSFLVLLVLLCGCKTGNRPEPLLTSTSNTPEASEESTITATPIILSPTPTQHTATPTIQPTSTPSVENQTNPWVIEEMGDILLFGNISRNNEHLVYQTNLDRDPQLLGYGELVTGQPWSPDKTQIIVRTSDARLAIVNLLTGSKEDLNLEEYTSTVYWSPNGKYILYSLPSSENSLMSRLVLYNLEDQQNKYLTEASRILSVAGWSSDSTKIGFVSNLSGQFDLYTLEIESLALQQLTDNLSLEIESSWSPVEDKLLFGAPFTNEIPEVGPFPIKELFTVDSSGLNLTLIGDFYYENPTWSLDGQKIAFTRGWICFLQIKDGTENCPTPDIPNAHSIFPGWSTDGNFIAFRATVTEAVCYRIFILDVSSNTVKEVETARQSCGTSHLYWTSLADS